MRHLKPGDLIKIRPNWVFTDQVLKHRSSGYYVVEDIIDESWIRIIGAQATHQSDAFTLVKEEEREAAISAIVDEEIND